LRGEVAPVPTRAAAEALIAAIHPARHAAYAREFARVRKAAASGKWPPALRESARDQAIEHSRWHEAVNRRHPNPRKKAP